MIAVKPTQMRENFKILCDRVVDGETIIVSRPNNKNVVVISEGEYNAMQKAANNAAYLDKIDRSIQQLAAGKTVTKSMKELEDMAK
jgi:Antitoxin of toxin-antitoxin stability system